MATVFAASVILAFLIGRLSGKRQGRAEMIEAMEQYNRIMNLKSSIALLKK